MIVAKGEYDGEDMVMLGLSHENVTRLLNNQPIVVQRKTHGDAIPDGLTIIVVADVTEEKIAEKLKRAGLVDDMTTILKSKTLGTSDDT